MESRGMVTRPYSRNVFKESWTNITPAHRWLHTKTVPAISTSQGRIKNNDKCNVIYEIPCWSCNKSYIGETGRSFSTRRKKHQKRMREGDRRKTDVGNKGKGTTRNTQVSHNQPLQKRKSYYVLEHGQSHPHWGQQILTLDQGGDRDMKTGPEDDEPGWGRLHAFPHLEQYLGAENGQREEWLTCQIWQHQLIKRVTHTIVWTLLK